MAESPVQNPQTPSQTTRRLNSWKEIAAYFNRDVRTVQRWESELGLPVHRRPHTRRGIVYAYQPELETWWKKGKQGLDEANPKWTRKLVAGVVIAAILLAGGYAGWRHIRGRTAAVSIDITKTWTLTGGGMAKKATISPDGRYVAYTLEKSGQQSLVVRKTTSLEDTEIVPPGSPYFLGITFSRDSDSIYYVTGTAGGAPSRLYRIPVTGGTAQKLKEAIDSPVTFSPDGQKLAFIREGASESTLIIADLESSAEQRVLSHRLPNVLDYPAWSPDGRVIACTAVDSSAASPKGSDARIIEVNVATRAERPLSSRSWPFIRQLAWLGAGNGLIMSARDQGTGAFHLWYVPRGGGEARKLTDGLNTQAGVSVSGDNRVLSVEERTLSGIWLMGPGNKHDGRPVTHESENCNKPVWTTDGRIIFEQQLNGQYHVWSMAADGSSRKQLTQAGSNYDPSISRNGRKLAYVSDRNGRPAIWIMDMDGGNATMLLSANGEPYPEISPDGTWIAFTATGKDHWPTLRRISTAGGPVTELNKNMWLQPAISPDGERIAGFYLDQPSGTQKFPNSIAVISSAGGRPAQVIPITDSVSTSARIRWSTDGRELMYVEQKEEGGNIWSRRWDGGPAHQLTQLHGYTLFSFDWSRDGKKLALSRGIQARDVVLRETRKSSP